MATALLEAGEAALAEGRWADARAAFEAALAEEESARALEGLGTALWWLGETRLGVECSERAFAEHRRAGDGGSAAVTAMALAITYKANFGNQAAAAGWVARAERLLGADAGPLQGYLWSTRAYVTRDVAAAVELLERALELAREHGDLDLELLALADLGERLVEAGRVEEGLALVDEAMAGTLAGECSRLETVVFTCCDMLTACDFAGDVERATEWCRVADNFIREYGCPFLFAHCRTLYGSILVAKGRWQEGERELRAALRMTGEAGPGLHADALARLADLRLRQGRIEEAEALLGDADDAVPAAAVRLARGEPAVAALYLERRLDAIGDEHVAAPVALALLVDAHLAAGDVAAASRAAARLEAVAAQGRLHAEALSTLAGARLYLVAGDVGAAADALERARDLFARVELPHETARVRLELARVLAGLHPEVAVDEARRAHESFRRLGAATDADAAAALLRSLGASARTGPRSAEALTTREQEVLRLVGLGLSNPEIAQRLFISRKTASHHVSRVLAKLGLRNRAEAVAYAARLQRESVP